MANNIIGGAPNAIVAKSNTSFATAGLNSTNTEIIFEVGNPLKSYKPGRAINGINAFTANKGYWLVAKIDFDLETYVVPPIDGVVGDTTPPTISTKSTTDATHIAILFSEVVTSGLTGWSFRKNGSALAASAVAGTGTNTLTFTVATMAPGDTLDVSYDPGTGNCMDAASNELATVTNSSVTNGLGAELITWAQLTAAANSGSGDLTATGGLPAGGTATKKLAKANGNYVQQTVPADLDDSPAAVIALVETDDADYAYGGANELLAGTWQFTGNLNSISGPTSGTADAIGTVDPGDIIRLEISGNDILVKLSTNGGTSFTTAHTYTGVLTGITDIFVKGILAVGTAGRLLNKGEGLGLTV